ncbi:MAG: hypothetical protein ACPG4T_03730 [Nannocystaceae bacterium]
MRSSFFRLKPVSSHFLPAVLAATALAPGLAQAGIPECAGIRLETAGSCELKGDIDCNAGCDELGIYKKSCATQLHTVCREECTVLSDPVCTGGCSETCLESCDLGVNVICQHNCFGECVGSCDASCAGAEDPVQCMASCEATCDGECDVQCAVVDGGCVEHCIECCGGSCTAQANMDCQTTCQDEEFETCEYDLKVDCQASCTGDGALFCDGEYIAVTSGQLLGCFNALVALGVSAVDLRVELDIDGDSNGDVDLDPSTGGGFCSVGDSPIGPLGSGLLLALGLAYRQPRRKRR